MPWLIAYYYHCPVQIVTLITKHIVIQQNLYINLICLYFSGTKCVSGEHLSESGSALNDCHAEVVARRCLCEYLYSQLEMYSEMRGDESILEPTKTGYKVRDGIQFHLYINTAPCGDARIFSPHEETESVDKHPNRRARGQLRTKIESGEGTIPVKSNEGIQTWDGVLMVSRNSRSILFYIRTRHRFFPCPVFFFLPYQLVRTLP